MSRGYIVIAQNNGTVDYLEQVMFITTQFKVNTDDCKHQQYVLMLKLKS